ncbi:unnamed protein product [Closterium sp. Naga37s-1]|nr:unnamed protein product [Closterium sp. Naga37s-1]
MSQALESQNAPLFPLISPRVIPACAYGSVGSSREIYQSEKSPTTFVAYLRATHAPSHAPLFPQNPSLVIPAGGYGGAYGGSAGAGGEIYQSEATTAAFVAYLRDVVKPMMLQLKAAVDPKVQARVELKVGRSNWRVRGILEEATRLQASILVIGAQPSLHGDSFGTGAYFIRNKPPHMSVYVIQAGKLLVCHEADGQITGSPAALDALALEAAAAEAAGGGGGGGGGGAGGGGGGGFADGTGALLGMSPGQFEGGGPLLVDQLLAAGLRLDTPAAELAALRLPAEVLEQLLAAQVAAGGESRWHAVSGGGMCTGTSPAAGRKLKASRSSVGRHRRERSGGAGSAGGGGVDFAAMAAAASGVGDAARGAGRKSAAAMEIEQMRVQAKEAETARLNAERRLLQMRVQAQAGRGEAATEASPWGGRGDEGAGQVRGEGGVARCGSEGEGSGQSQYSYELAQSQKEFEAARMKLASVEAALARAAGRTKQEDGGERGAGGAGSGRRTGQSGLSVSGGGGSRGGKAGGAEASVAAAAAAAAAAAQRLAHRGGNPHQRFEQGTREGLRWGETGNGREEDEGQESGEEDEEEEEEEEEEGEEEEGEEDDELQIDILSAAGSGVVGFIDGSSSTFDLSSLSPRSLHGADSNSRPPSANTRGLTKKQQHSQNSNLSFTGGFEGSSSDLQVDLLGGSSLGMDKGTGGAEGGEQPDDDVDLSLSMSELQIDLLSPGENMRRGDKHEKEQEEWKRGKERGGGELGEVQEDEEELDLGLSLVGGSEQDVFGDNGRGREGGDSNGGSGSGSGSRGSGSGSGSRVSGSSGSVGEIVEEREREGQGRGEAKEKGGEGEGKGKRAGAVKHVIGRGQYRVYSYEEIQAATDNFNQKNRLGEGAFGTVYGGRLHHTRVAVKVLKATDVVKATNEFQQEVEVLSQIQHPHVVMLLGCCPSHHCIVYEFMASGTLEERLLCANNSPPLPWFARLRIAAEVASALLILHARPIPIVHRDLKPANILLDKNLVAKLGDVGLAKLMPGTGSQVHTHAHDSVPVGTLAYVDPEFQRTGDYGPKSDVYALGIILFDILTGRKPTTYEELEEAVDEGDEEAFGKLLDERGGEWPIGLAMEVARMAVRCSEMRRKKRPDLESEVMPLLARARDEAAEAEEAAGKEGGRSGGSGDVPKGLLCPINKQPRPMGVKLQIQLLEARGLPPKDNGGARDAFARLQMGASKARSSTVPKDNDPTWQEEFFFSVSDAEKDELLVTVWDKSAFLGEEFLGQLVLPVRQVLACDGYELQATWFPLQNRLARPRATVTGDVLISASLWGVSSLVAESASPSTLPSSPILPPTPPLSAPSASPSTSPLAAPSPAPSPSLISTVSFAFPKPSSAHPLSAPTPPSATPRSATPPSASPPSAPPPSAPSPSAPAFSLPLKPALRRHTGPSDTVAPAALSPCKETDEGEAWGGGGKEGRGDGATEGEGGGEGGAEGEEVGEENGEGEVEGEGEGEREGHEASADLQGKEEEGANGTTTAAAPAAAAVAKPRHQILQSLSESLKPKPQQLQQLKQRLHASKLSAASAIRSFGHAVENSVAKAGQTVRAANAKGGGGGGAAGATAHAREGGDEGEGESRRGSLGEGDGASGGGSGESGEGGTGEAGKVKVPGVWWEQDMRDVPSAGPMPGELPGGGVLVDQAFDAAPHVLFAAIFKPGSPFFQEFANERKLTQVNIGPWFFADSSSSSSHSAARLNRSTAHKGIKPPTNLPPAAAPKGGGGAEQQQEDTGTVMHRTVSYMTAPSSLVKSVQATEEVLCVRADAGGFLVAVTAKTPDVPYGGTFEIHLQLCITPLTEEGVGAGGGAGEGGNTGEQSSRVPASAAAGDGRETGAEGSGSGMKSRLRVSYEPHFLQSTMMKGMIENGMRTGLKESYATFLSVLTKHVPPFVSTAPSTSLSQPSTSPPPSSPLGRLLSRLGVPPHLIPSKTAIAEAALRATGPLALFVFFLAVVLLPTHLVLVARGGAGVVLPLLDLPDSLLELLWCAVILVATNHVVAMARGIIVSKYIKKGDHGKKAVGEGWLLTVSLVEGESIGDAGVVMKADPFVVFACSGKTRTSSVKLQTNMPKWNEVLEFDAMEDAPSILEIEVFNYDGPFSEPSLLGRAEINFLRQSAQDLADLWVPLEGRRAKVQAARIHVRVLLTNTSEAAAPLVLQKISKEVGSKGGVREFSLQKNLAFQRLFDVPDSECLINDFSPTPSPSLPPLPSPSPHQGGVREFSLQKNLAFQRLFDLPRRRAFQPTFFYPPPLFPLPLAPPGRCEGVFLAEESGVPVAVRPTGQRVPHKRLLLHSQERAALLSQGRLHRGASSSPRPPPRGHLHQTHPPLPSPHLPPLSPLSPLPSPSPHQGGVREFSLQKNLAFQRLFDLPDSECLINDFSCILKKGLLSQGRLFLSPRLLAFYSSVFGTRIKFTLLWEDIDEIDDSVPSLFDQKESQKDAKSQTAQASLTRSQPIKNQTAAAAQKSSMTTFKRMLNPAITVFVKKDKGTAETRAAAHGVDSHGRLKIRFQSFVRPGVAFRLVLALWRNRNLPTDQQLARAKEEGDASDSGGERGEGTNVGRDGGAGAATGVSSSRGDFWGARGGMGGYREVTDSRRESIAVEDGGGAFMGVETREVIDDQLVGVPITVQQFLASFDDPAATAAMMEKAGQMGAEIGEWEAVEVGMGDGVGQLEGRAAGGRVGGVLRRQRSVKYRFSRQVPVLSPTVTAVQQMTQEASTPGSIPGGISGGTPGGSQDGGIQWACLEQVLTLHRVPFGDSFQLEFFQEIKAKEIFSLPGAASTAAGAAAADVGAGKSSAADTAYSSSSPAEAAASAARGAAAVASALVAAAGALKLTARGAAAASGTATGDGGGAGEERGTAGGTAGAAGGTALGASGLQEGVLQDDRVRSVLHVRMAIAWHKELSEATRSKIKSSIGRFYKQQARRVVELMAAQGT